MTTATPAATVEHGPLRVSTLSTGPLQENAVLVWDAASGEGYLIDPGDEAGKLLGWVMNQGVKVRGILLTHAHFDHIGAVQPLREALNVPVWLHERDLPLYRAGQQSASRWNLPFVQPADPDHFITQDQVFSAGKLRLKARELPGHAPGHVVFVGEGLAVVGDTLFQGGIGRTDLPGGNHPQLMQGIVAELLSLPRSTALYPGHGASSSVAAEQASNPFLM
ncbi:hydrolase [Deinococcus irradiatisoli]|uniref:Hydrolase n=1 Tax=Deinococcus irradiatisoli TaxID=2202254 RepID=A0A2Z3JFL7_9DEIO|nr:MBL fold metallo-hydrolase [Deinococcus irradiatisoli]AWN22271.1 hydrolase [Deinococcus irradiatisoli]